MDLAVMHPELFDTFLDVAGDAGPTAGTKDQTIQRLFDGDAAQYDHYDPATVMTAHGPYSGVAGLFEDLTPAAPHNGNGQHPADGHGWQVQAPQGSSPDGFGGRDDTRDTGETGAAEKLCAVATTEAIDCSVQTTQGGHTWQFAETAFTAGLPWLSDRLGTGTDAAAATP